MRYQSNGLTDLREIWHDPGRISQTYLASESGVPGLSCGVVCVILRVAVLVELGLVTDGHRQTQTDTGPWLVPRMHSIAW